MYGVVWCELVWFGWVLLQVLIANMLLLISIPYFLKQSSTYVSGAGDQPMLLSAPRCGASDTSFYSAICHAVSKFVLTSNLLLFFYVHHPPIRLMVYLRLGGSGVLALYSEL